MNIVLLILQTHTKIFLKKLNLNQVFKSLIKKKAKKTFI